jgi:hypothetical protein
VDLALAHFQLIRPSKVIAKALSAGFHLVTLNRPGFGAAAL